MKIIYFSIVLSIASLVCQGQTNFYYTGSVQTYVVPAGVTAISVDMQGATGGTCGGYAMGGAGGRTQAIIYVSPGQIFYVYVGGKGGDVSHINYENDAAGTLGAFGGGGGTYPGDNVGGGAGGGGASDIRLGDTALSSRIVVAAGGGGGCEAGTAGDGGGLTGGNGSSYGGLVVSGGTQSGGASLGYDGSGSGGGGGGGYFGGMAGNNFEHFENCGGGGGSSYVAFTAASATFTAGYNTSGNGVVSITPMPVCSGVAGGGTANVTPTRGNVDTTFYIWLEGETVAAGLSFQWQSSFTNSAPWTDISGATNATMILTGIDTTTFYHCIVSCDSSGTTAASEPTKVYIYPECLCINGFAQTTFYYTGAMQTYTVPKGVYALSVDMQGAKGGGSNFGPAYQSTGGAGGRTEATVNVSPGQTIYVNVGGIGDTFYSICWMCEGEGGEGGYGGGGQGGGGGGGASDIRVGDSGLGNRTIVAAGGGGAGCSIGVSGANGGAGGGLVGNNGAISDTFAYDGCGEGGTQTAGGMGSEGNNGSLGNGAAGYEYDIPSGGSPNDMGNGGGGGGGFYGGGGGGTSIFFGGGGGGSSYADPSATNVVFTTGYNNVGNGIVIITPLFECSATVTAGNAVASPVYGSDTTTFTISLAGTSRDSGLTYQWQESASGTSPWTNIAGATNANYTFSRLDTNTFFRCEVTCLLGTSTDSSSGVQVQIYPEGIATTGLSHLKVYPNPATNIVIIDGAINCELEIIDIVGREVIPAHLVASSNEKVDVSQLDKGVYFFKIQYPLTGVREVREIVKK